MCFFKCNCSTKRYWSPLRNISIVMCVSMFILFIEVTEQHSITFKHSFLAIFCLKPNVVWLKLMEHEGNRSHACAFMMNAHCDPIPLDIRVGFYTSTEMQWLLRGAAPNVRMSICHCHAFFGARSCICSMQTAWKEPAGWTSRTAAVRWI